MRISFFFTGFLLASFAPKMIQSSEKKIVQKTSSKNSKGSIEQTPQKKSNTRQSGTIEKIFLPNPKTTPKTSKTELQQVTVDPTDQGKDKIVKNRSLSLGPLLKKLEAKATDSKQNIITAEDIADEAISSLERLVAYVAEQHNIANKKPIEQVLKRVPNDQHKQYLAAAANHEFHKNQLVQQTTTIPGTPGNEASETQEISSSQNNVSPTQKTESPENSTSTSQEIVDQTGELLAKLNSFVLSNLSNDAQKSSTSASSRLKGLLTSLGGNGLQAIGTIILIIYQFHNSCGNSPSNPPA